MATILRLTKVKKDEPIRVNFDLVAHYHAKGEHTEIMFLGQLHQQDRLTVKESLEVVDRLLGI